MNEDETGIKRINCAVDEATVAALLELTTAEDISLQEAIRRFVAWGKLVYDTVKVEEKTLLIVDHDGELERVNIP